MLPFACTFTEIETWDRDEETASLALVLSGGRTHALRLSDKSSDPLAASALLAMLEEELRATREKVTAEAQSTSNAQSQSSSEAPIQAAPKAPRKCTKRVQLGLEAHALLKDVMKL